MSTWTDWIEFLEAQARALLDAQSALPAEELAPERECVPDPEEWLLADMFLCSAKIDTAAREFIKTGEWPALDDRNTQALLHRILLAVAASQNLAGELPAVPMPAMPAAPAVDDRAAVLRWLFLDLWAAEGEAHLKRWHQRTRAAQA